MRVVTTARMLAVAVVVTIPLLAAAPASAEPTDEKLPGLREFLDDTVSAHLSDHDIPGATVTVVSEGKQVLSEGYGTADVAAGTSVDPAKHGFFTGSVSKVFISQAALQQVEAGELDLDTDVNEYLEDLHIAEAFDAPVTMRHLLTHTAGFDEELAGVFTTEPEEIDELGKWVEDNQPQRVREPGTVVSYDNYGTALAARVVEVVSGESFADYTAEHIFAPLGMDSTTMRVPLPETIEGNLSEGYLTGGVTPTHQQYAGMVPAGAGPVTTSQDMGRWMIAQMDEDSPQADVAAEMAEIMYKQDERIPGGMGALYEEYERGGVLAVNKGGDLPGFHSMMSMIPEHDTGIYVSFNGDSDNDAGTLAVTHAFVDEYFAGETPSAEPVGGDAAPYEGEYEASRTSHHSVTRAFSLLAPAVTVTDLGDGAIRTTGLTVDPTAGPQTWDQIEPGVFAERDGQARLAIDGEGRLATSDIPILTFEKLPWYAATSLHLVIFGIATALLAAGALWLPVMAVVRRVRHRPPHPRPARLARLAAVVTGGWLLISLFFFGWLLVDEEALTSASLPLAVMPWAMTLMLPLAAGLLIATVTAWVKRWWKPLGRITYSLLAAAAVAVAVLAVPYQFTVL